MMNFRKLLNQALAWLRKQLQTPPAPPTEPQKPPVEPQPVPVPQPEPQPEPQPTPVPPVPTPDPPKPPDPTPAPIEPFGEESVKAIVRNVKAQAERDGVKFLSRPEASALTDKKDSPDATAEDVRQFLKQVAQPAFYVLKRVVWHIHQTYPEVEVGLEAYGGTSQIDGYSFDTFLTKHPPQSVDILGGGVEPQWLSDPHATMSAWREPVNPF